MVVPDWRTSTSGTRVRAALWLHHEVGVGGTFTKALLRKAFPGVEQIDRRMRDLRADGWQIATFKEDRSLAPDELRLVAEGGAVWEEGYTSLRPPAITPKERQATMKADGYSCVYCGIAGGETYADDPLRQAKLTVVRREGPKETAGTPLLSTTCDRCKKSDSSMSLDEILSQVDKLPLGERGQLAEWVQRGSRPRSPGEELFGAYRRLPEADRRRLRTHLLD